MKTLKKINTYDFQTTAYKNLKVNEQFIYNDFMGEWFAVKIDNDYAALIDDAGLFFLMSVKGDVSYKEFNSLTAAKRYINKIWEKIWEKERRSERQ